MACIIRFDSLFWTVNHHLHLLFFWTANTDTKTEANTANNPRWIVEHWCPSLPCGKRWSRRRGDRCQNFWMLTNGHRRWGDDEHREQQRRTQRTDCKDIGTGDVRWPDMVSTACTAYLIHTITTLVTAAKRMGVVWRPTNLSWHISFSCFGSEERGSRRAQNWHGAGSSEIAFSTARFRLHNVRLISHRHPGQVGVSSFRRASANRCERQLAHIRWPFVHCNSQTDSKVICNCNINTADLHKLQNINAILSHVK